MDELRTLLVELAEKSINLSLVDDNVRFSAPDGALTDELVERLRAAKPALVELLRSQRESLPPILELAPADSYPASPNQEIIFRSQQTDTAGNSRHNLWLIDLPDGAKPGEVQEAVSTLVARHEALRTVLVEEGGLVRQVVAEPGLIPVELVEQTVHNDDEFTAFLRIFSRPRFDLTTGPLFRCALVVTPEATRLVLCLHETVSDGTSHQVAISDLGALLRGERPEPLQLHYKEFAAWHRQVLESPLGARNLAQVAERLAGQVPRTYLPFDRTAGQGARRSRRHRFEVGAETVERLRRISADTSASLNAIVQTVLTVVLTKLSGERQVIYSSAISLRHTPELQRIVGLFVGTLFLRHRVQRDDTFRTLLGRVNAENLSAVDHRHYDLAQALDGVDQRWDPDRFIVTPIILNHLTYADREAYNKIQAPLSADMWREPKVEFELYVRDFPDSMEFTCDYRADLFTDEVIAALFEQFTAVLEALATDVDQPLGNVELEVEPALPRTDHQMAVDGFDTELPHADMITWVTEQAAATPDAVALTWAGTGATLSYRELLRRVDVVAARLEAEGIVPGQPVAILDSHPLRRTVMMLAVMKLGAVFCFFDHALPAARRSTQLAAIDPQAIVADGAALSDLDDTSGLDVVGDILIAATELEPESAAPTVAGRRVVGVDWKGASPQSPATSFVYGHDDPAYIYFTSGSTGVPKPILGRMSAIVQFIRWEHDELDLPERPQVAQIAAPTFDASLRDLFVPLVAGGTACFPGSRADVVDPAALLSWLDGAGVQLVHCTPTTLRTLLAAEPTSDRLAELRHVLCSGEALLPADVTRFQDIFGDRVGLANLYGPTECTMVRTFHRIPNKANHGDYIPVGRPIDSTVVLLVNDAGEPCGFEEEGEVYIGSEFLSLGYHDRPQDTAEAFVTLHDVDPRYSVPFYRTGDLAIRTTDGNLRLLGRRDRQVKINGIRVEPREVEAVALGCDGVTGAALRVHQRSIDDVQLLLYLTGPASPADVRRQLADELPTWLLPQHVQTIDVIPLTASKKVDYNALPLPDELATAAEAEAALTATEAALGVIWAGILGQEVIGPDDNFFLLGGNSLKALLLISQIEKEFQVQPVMRDVFLNATLRACASHIEELTLQASVFRAAAPAGAEDEERAAGFL